MTHFFTQQNYLFLPSFCMSFWLGPLCLQSWMSVSTVYHWFNDYSPACVAGSWMSLHVVPLYHIQDGLHQPAPTAATAMGTRSSSTSSSSTSIPTQCCTALISILNSHSLSAWTSNLSSTWSSFSQSPCPQRASREAQALQYFDADAHTWLSIHACHSLARVLCIWPVTFAIFHLLAWDHVHRWCHKSSIALCASASHICSSICNRLGWQNWWWVRGDSEDGM